MSFDALYGIKKLWRFNVADLDRWLQKGAAA